MKYSSTTIAIEKEKLLKYLIPGSTVYCKLNHVSRSGMQRSITPLVIIDNKPQSIVYSASIILGYRQDTYGGISMSGCGMDMGYALVYALSSVLFPLGFGLEGENENGDKFRPDSESAAEHAIYRGYKFFGRNGDESGWDDEGGYALKHSWI